MDLLGDAAARAQRYLSEVRARRVFPSDEALRALQGWSRPLQEEPVGAAGVLAELDAIGSPATVGSAGGRYFGFVVGGCLPAALAAHVLATAWDQNAGLEACSPLSAHLERVCRSWLTTLLGLPQAMEVGFTTGATMANFTGLAAARHAVLQARGWDVEARGLFGAPPVTVIVGAEVHVSLLKALSMLGLGRERVVQVAADGQGKMIAAQLPRICGPTIVCTQAGNVNTGAFDPIADVVSSVRGTGAWVHVDGAFGLWAAASPKRRYLAQGVEQADSLAADAQNGSTFPTTAAWSSYATSTR